ncbi:Fic family protein [Pseudoalteromonas sp. Hal040]|uniref:Fic family protein n=1 Tax=unclassified Pseudoalteromonas TaxID=194690 RepID=UPI00301E32D6
MLNLDGTPYLLDTEAEKGIVAQIKRLEERVELLRSSGTLTEETLVKYYGARKFEQVAESNAIEGSTLSVGETELAVLKGITTTGHDPAYVKDAISLEKALVRLAEMAKNQDSVTEKQQLRELHEIILGDRPSAGLFRQEPVRIKGADHKPPKTWEEVMDAMDEWEKWSIESQSLPAVVRATILHAWLAHIHPFIDGNGRTARAISNLELVRAGYPPIILRKKERDRYIEALAESDSGGDIRSFFELIIERADGALTGLELAAKQKQDYNPVIERIKQKQTNNLKIWETSVSLLVKTTQHYLDELLEQVGGSTYIKEFESPLDLEDYLGLTKKQSVSRSWCFIVNVSVPGIEKLERLAYISYRQPQLFHHMGNKGGPAIYWSKKNPEGYPKWITDEAYTPYCTEMTIEEGVGDAWSARLIDGTIVKLSTSELAKNIAHSLVELAADNR